MAFKEEQTFLVSPNLIAARARSRQAATGVGCDGTGTVFWWQCTQLTDGRGAMHVDPTGPYGPNLLTPGERNQLKSWGEVEPFWPPPPSMPGISRK